MNKGIYQADGRLWADWPEPKKLDYYDPHPAAENEGGFALAGYYSDHEKWESRPNLTVHPDLPKVWEVGKMYEEGKDYQLGLKCLLCGRDKFDRPSPHHCAGGYRKHKIQWQQFAKPIAVPIPAKQTKTINMTKEQAINVLIQDADHNKISDGYHTFGELYEFRKLYNAALFNEWANRGIFEVHKSYRHYDGEKCFGGGWFIVVAILPEGQISNHYKNEDWDLFKVKETVKALFPYDGHTSKDVLSRLKSALY